MRYLQLLRPGQWIKNIFLFLPLFFAGDLFNDEKLARLFWGFLLFSLTASSIYEINDYRDREKDALHPVKQFRPLAAGTVKPFKGLLLSAVLIMLSLAGS